MRNNLVERRGDEWHVCRMENATMRVWVGKYRTEEEALIAHQIATEHLAEREAWVAAHRETLAPRIKEALNERNNKQP